MNYKSTKFLISLMFTVSIIIFTAIKLLNGGEFITAMALVIGLYSGANLTERKIKGE